MQPNTSIVIRDGQRRVGERMGPHAHAWNHGARLESKCTRETASTRTKFNQFHRWNGGGIVVETHCRISMLHKSL